MKSKSAGAFTIGGAITFVATVVGLQYVQTGYDFIHQHISELALGRAGALMVLGFSGFGVSIFSAQIGLGTSAAPKTIRALLSCAALCMVGAGLFTLNNAAELHIALIAAAFMLLVISMYLLPISVSKFSSLSSRAASWLFAGGTTVSVALGGRIPEGITQRTAVLCIIAWLIWVGTRIFSAEEMMPNHCR